MTRDNLRRRRPRAPKPSPAPGSTCPGWWRQITRADACPLLCAATVCIVAYTPRVVAQPAGELWWRAADQRFRVALSGQLGYADAQGDWFDGFTSGPSVGLTGRCAMRPKWFLGTTVSRQQLGVEPRLNQPLLLGVDAEGHAQYADVAWDVTLDEVYGLVGTTSQPRSDRWPFLFVEAGLGAAQHRLQVALRYAGAEASETTRITKLAVLLGTGCTLPLSRHLGFELAARMRVTGTLAGTDEADVGNVGALWSAHLGCVVLLGGSGNGDWQRLHRLGNALARHSEAQAYTLRVDLYAPRILTHPGSYVLKSEDKWHGTKIGGRTAPGEGGWKEVTTPGTTSEEYWNVVTGRRYESARVAAINDSQSSKVAIPAGTPVRVVRATVQVDVPALVMTVEADAWHLDPRRLRRPGTHLSPAAQGLADSLLEQSTPTPPDGRRDRFFWLPGQNGIAASRALPITMWPTDIGPAAELIAAAGTRTIVTSQVRFECDGQSRTDAFEEFHRMWELVLKEPCPITPP